MWRVALRQKTIQLNRSQLRRRGNVILEFALVMTPFFALALTTIELALPIFKKSTFENAVREGCRYGITYQTTYNGMTYGSQTLAIQAVVEANGMGFLNDPTLILVDYFNSSTFVKVTGQPGANSDGNILQVSILGYTHKWIAPVAWFWGATTFQINPAPLSITAVSADRLESLPPGNTRPSP
jgi:Flp pilus assembly protein TadG